MNKSFLNLIFVSLTFLSGSVFAAKNCKKGKPCGNACISVDDVCHKDEESSSEASAPAEPSSGQTTVQKALNAVESKASELTQDAKGDSKKAEKTVAAKVKECKKGKLCGTTCIAEKAVCHVK